MGVGCFFWGKIFGKLSVLGNLAACAQVSRRLRVVGSTRTFNIRSSHWLIPNTAHAQSGDNLRLGRAISFSQNIDIRSSKLCVQLTVDFYEGRSSQLYTHLIFCGCEKKAWKTFLVVTPRHGKLFAFRCSISLLRSSRSSQYELAIWVKSQTGSTSCASSIPIEYLLVVNTIPYEWSKKCAI